MFSVNYERKSNIRALKILTMLFVFTEFTATGINIHSQDRWADNSFVK